MPPTAYPVTEEAVARTYAGGHYDDPWTVVQQYREVLQYAPQHPNEGSAAVAGALNLPRNRIKLWVDDEGKPRPVRAIETARSSGWIGATYGDPTFEGMNALVANVLSGGNISAPNYRPTFTLSHPERRLPVFEALERVGVAYRIVERDAGRADEVRIADAGSILGRCLAVLGAPVGSKVEGRVSLPPYLDDAPRQTRETFVHVYLQNRGTESPKKDTLVLQETRSKRYHRKLAGVIDSVVEGPVYVGENAVRLSAETVRWLEDRVAASSTRLVETGD